SALLSKPTAESASEPEPPYVSRKRAARAETTSMADTGRATRASSGSPIPRPRSAATAAGDANTPQARHRQRGARSSRTTSRPARARSIAVSAPAGPPPTTATSTRSALTGGSPGCLGNAGRGCAHAGRRDRPAVARQPADLRDGPEARPDEELARLGSGVRPPDGERAVVERELHAP